MDYNPYHLSSLLGGLQFVDSNIHEISGTVTLPDSRTIVINDFNYDGLGVGKRECYILVCKKGKIPGSPCYFVLQAMAGAWEEG